MENIPWFAWIVIVAIIAWVPVAIVGQLEARRARNTDLAQALLDNTAAHEQLLERLDGIEQRLATIEKTLTDIP